MTQVRWLLFALCVAACTSTPLAKSACACSCDPKDVPTSFANADRVVRGRVTGIVRDRVSGLLRVDVEVAETFKSLDPTRTALLTRPDGASCGYEFRVGQEYVVFATHPVMFAFGTVTKLPSSALIVHMCGGTAEVRSLHGKQTLDALRRLAPRK